MPAHTVRFARHLFHLDPARALWWPGEKLLVVSDLHLGKGHSYAQHGALLPPYDAGDTLARLASLIVRYQPRTLICLGDSFHRADSYKRLAEAERTALLALVAYVPEWIWIVGNHDEGMEQGLPGHTKARFERHGIRFQHEPDEQPGRRTLTKALQKPDAALHTPLHVPLPTVIGHFHPKARLPLHRKRVHYPCFAWNDALLVMPSFGTFTGGLDAADATLVALLGPEMRLACASGEEVFRVEKQVFAS